MRIHTLLLMLVVAFAARAFGQNELPIIGSIDDLKGLSRVYVVADNESRKAILKELKKQQIFDLVDIPDDAEFFLEYKTISRQQFSGLIGGTTETGQLDAYVNRAGKKVVAWSESTTGGGFKGDTANRLIKKFLKRVKAK